MHSLEEMVSLVRKQADLDTKSLAACIDACSSAVAICTMCADACAAEPEFDTLRRCIRLCLDCADLCGTTVRILSRGGQPDSATLRSALEACSSIAQACAAECRKHADHHGHCRVCAETCAMCARACVDALEMLFEGPSA
jgi:hypothetical protein